MSGCTECSRTQPNGISFPAPRTVRGTIDRPSTPVYFTRLSLFIASGRSGLLSDCAVGAAVDFRFPLVFSATSGRRAWDGGIRPAPRIACCCPSLLLLITICPVYRLFTVYVGPPVLIEGLSGERYWRDAGCYICARVPAPWAFRQRRIESLLTFWPAGSGAA